MAKAEAKKTVSESEELRTQLVALLDGGQAHATFADAVKDFPAELRGVVPEGLPLFGVADGGAHADCAAGHSGFFRAADGRVPGDGVAGGLLAEGGDAGVAEAWDRAVAAVRQDLREVQEADC